MLGEVRSCLNIRGCRCSTSSLFWHEASGQGKMRPYVGWVCWKTCAACSVKLSYEVFFSLSKEQSLRFPHSLSFYRRKALTPLASTTLLRMRIQIHLHRKGRPAPTPLVLPHKAVNTVICESLKRPSRVSSCSKNTEGCGFPSGLGIFTNLVQAQ